MSAAARLPARPARHVPRPGRWASWRMRFGQDHMARNSMSVMATAALQGALGFAFWIVAARVFSAADVGRASSLVSASTVIAYLALLGLNNTFGRYLPTAGNRQEIISSGLALVGVCGAVFALVYGLVAPMLVSRLAFVTQAPLLVAGFVLVTAAAAVNLLTDSVFVATRHAEYMPVVDGVVGGTGRLLAALLLTGAGAGGLFFASAVGAVLPAIVSVALIFTVMRCRVSLSRPLHVLRPMLRFSGANYVSNILLVLPTLVVPLIVFDRLGAATAAYYFVDYQVASILYAAAISVEQSFLAEGSHGDLSMRLLKRRSRRILVLLCLPTALGLALLAHWILLAFGWRYFRYGATSLVVLAIGAAPVAANYWLITILRLAGKLRALVTATAIYAGSICGLAWLGTSHGLVAVAAAWPAGALLAAAVAGACVPRETPGRHRRGAARAYRGTRRAPAGLAVLRGHQMHRQAARP
jgi:O-antigen/teichoic acid export membrane protein